MRAKLLTVGKGGVCAYYSDAKTISGYIGHDWTDDVDAETVVIDSREVPVDLHCKLAISGPMVGVDLPPGMVDRAFGQAPVPFRKEGDKHNARSLDYVSLDVYCGLYQEAGAQVYRGEAAVAFAALVSGPRRESA